MQVLIRLASFREYLTVEQLRFVDPSKDVIVLESVQMDIVIRRNATFLLSHISTNGLPTFVKISLIFKQEGSLRILSTPVLASDSSRSFIASK